MTVFIISGIIEAARALRRKHIGGDQAALLTTKLTIAGKKFRRRNLGQLNVELNRMLNFDFNI